MANLLQLLVFAYSLTIGATDGAFDQYEAAPAGVELIELGATPFVDFQAELALGPLFVGGGIRDDFKAIRWNSYDPVQDAYTVKAGLRITPRPGLSLEAGFAHTCYHPRDCYSIVDYIGGQKLAIPRFEGATDQVYISIRGRIGQK